MKRDPEEIIKKLQCELLVAHDGIRKLTTQYMKLASQKRDAENKYKELDKQMDDMVRFIQS